MVVLHGQIHNQGGRLDHLAQSLACGKLPYDSNRKMRICKSIFLHLLCPFVTTFPIAIELVGLAQMGEVCFSVPPTDLPWFV